MNKSFLNLKEIIQWQLSDLKQKLSWYIFKVKKYTSNFFYDVFIEGVEDDEIKKRLLLWFFDLEYYYGISIKKCSDIFSKFEEIVFPIEINGDVYDLQIKDEADNEYYFSICIDDNIFNYSITKRNLEQKFIYQITDTGIVLKDLVTLQFDEDNTDSGNIF